jgi:hypothetical protein
VSFDLVAAIRSLQRNKREFILDINQGVGILCRLTRHPLSFCSLWGVDFRQAAVELSRSPNFNVLP